MNEIYVTVSGNVVAEPESRTTKSGGVPFTAFRLASTVRRVNFKTGEFEDAATNYVNVTAFRALGANIANSVHKGEPVIVHGRMRVNQWARQDGTTGTSVEIDAYNVGHDLSRGTTGFTKVSRAQMDQSDRMADPEVQAAHALGEGLDPETDDYDVDGLDLGEGSGEASVDHEPEEALAAL